MIHFVCVHWICFVSKVPGGVCATPFAIYEIAKDRETSRTQDLQQVQACQGFPFVTARLEKIPMVTMASPMQEWIGMPL